jgi:catechol 2,3-dioxygenase-like lactoylglutathione lyase family enzyme
MEFERVRLLAAAAALPDLEDFYGASLGIEHEEARFGIGPSKLEFAPAAGAPFYHFALLVPGNRFDAALDWIRAHSELLPSTETGGVVFPFDDWEAWACYFEDPAGNIVELVAHAGIDENEESGEFTGLELLGFSELGLVGDKAAIARELEQLDLHLWTGTLDHPERLAFVGEKGRTLILSPECRGWMPTGRAAENHPVEAVISGRPYGEISVGGHRITRRG